MYKKKIENKTKAKIFCRGQIKCHANFLGQAKI